MAATKLSPPQTLHSECIGMRDQRFGGDVIHFRGIPYATISERFASPILATNWREHGPSFTEYGPQCPQPIFAPEAAISIPAEHQDRLRDRPSIKYDELKCCNLNVTCPDTQRIIGSQKLPVFVWIHGGGQSVSFPSAQHRLGDPGPLVAQSVEISKPIILVTINYRLNLFGFSDPQGVNVNLDVQDQLTAVRWVENYIHLFGGDPDNITIGGQSSGATYTHGLLAMDIRPRRAILASGSLYLTPPQDRDRCLRVHRWIEERLRANRAEEQLHISSTTQCTVADGDPASEWLLRTAHPDEIVKIIQSAGFFSWWMFDSGPLNDWQNDIKLFSNVQEAVLLSDCEEDGANYERRLRLTTRESHLDIFRKNLSSSDYAELAEVYAFEAAQGDFDKWIRVVLNFVTDARYALWPQTLWRRINSASAANGTAADSSGGVNCKAYLCHYDEVNPFGPVAGQSSAIAHHGVDLFSVFGGYDDALNTASKETGRLLRALWISFINGEEPWPSDMIYCFGLGGKNGPIPAMQEIDLQDQGRKTTTRRRQANFKVLEKIGSDSLIRIWQQLLPTPGVDG